MVGALAGTAGGVAWVVAAWNGELYGFSLWGMLGIVLGGCIAGAFVSNVAPRLIGMAAFPLSVASVLAGIVALFRGHPAYAAALVVCTVLLAGPQITAREVLRRSYGFPPSLD